MKLNGNTIGAIIYPAIFFAMVLIIFLILPMTAKAEHEDPGTNDVMPEVEKEFQYDPKIFQNMFRLPTLIDCGTPDKIMEMLNQYEEKPFAQGKTFVTRPDGMLQPGPFTFFVNAKTGSWSLVVQFTPETLGPIWCITAAGSSFGPVPLDTKI